MTNKTTVEFNYIKSALNCFALPSVRYQSVLAVVLKVVYTVLMFYSQHPSVSEH